MNQILITLMIKYATSMLGTPYIYGGNGAGGIDCSGFICELLRSAGLLDRRDRTAQAIYNHLKENKNERKITRPEMGDIVFFGKGPNEISHVAMIYSIEERIFIIESGGGNSKTNTIAIARKKGAQVRIRPLNSRNDVIDILSPL